jgi:hypothetical protein
MIFMRGLLACREMTNAAERDGHAADAGVIVVQRAQGGPHEIYEVRMVWEEGVLGYPYNRCKKSRFDCYVKSIG